MLNFLPILVSLFTSSAEAQTPSQNLQYWVRIPQTNLSCQEEAQRLADRFSQATGALVTEKICRGTVEATYDNSKYSLYSLLLTYTTDKMIYPYTALFGYREFESTPVNSIGLYTKYSECVAALSEQTANFEKETGLKSVSAYCNLSDFRNSYLMQIESFGNPQKRLYVFKSAFWGEVSSELEIELVKFLTNLNANLVAHTGQHYFYYRDMNLNLRQNMFGDFINPIECTSQIDSAVNIYKNGKSTQYIVTCLKLGNRTTLNGIADGEYLFDYKLKTNYFSFNECMEDRQRALQDDSMYKKPYGAICIEDTFLPGQYLMQIYQ